VTARVAQLPSHDESNVTTILLRQHFLDSTKIKLIN
jgi:hypothetical protein